MHGWLNKMVMIAFTHMMLMAEVMGYDTAPMEGFEQEKVHEVLRLPMSYWVVALLGVGHLQGPGQVQRRPLRDGPHRIRRRVRQAAEIKRSR